MDAAGAELIRQRIEQHEHWQLADAVRNGSQPATDPDRDHLEELRDDRRLYGLQQRHEVVSGTRALTTYRVQKRLVGGMWERELVVENVERVA
jgi:hypothetical protein